MNKLLSFTPEPFDTDPMPEGAFRGYESETGGSEWESEFEFRGMRSRAPRFSPSPPRQTFGQGSRPAGRHPIRVGGAPAFGPRRRIPAGIPPRVRFPILPIAPTVWPAYPYPAWSPAYAEPDAWPPDQRLAESPSEYVQWMQNCLNQLLGLRLPPDGLLSAATRSALRLFQELRGLPATGLADPQTERALAGACGAGVPAEAELSGYESGEWESWEGEINRGSSEYIRWVQTSLNRILGTRLAVDGVSGTQTRAAVRSFQQRRGLTADGIVGPNTEGALIAAGAGQPPGNAGGAPSPGMPGASSPSSAIDTFLSYSGPGYESKYVSSDSRFNQYGRSETILALQWIGREWQRRHPSGPKLYIGPMSKKGGGTLCYSDGVCHAEHKDGLDIDIRPVRKDQSKGALKFTDSSYSRPLTQELVDLARSNRCLPVEKILFNDPAVKGVTYSSGHDDHLHVSFKAPSGSLPAECRSAGSGYAWELPPELEQAGGEFFGDSWGS